MPLGCTASPVPLLRASAPRIPATPSKSFGPGIFEPPPPPSLLAPRDHLKKGANSTLRLAGRRRRDDGHRPMKTMRVYACRCGNNGSEGAGLCKLRVAEPQSSRGALPFDALAPAPAAPAAAVALERGRKKFECTLYDARRRPGRRRCGGGGVRGCMAAAVAVSNRVSVDENRRIL